MNSQCPGSTCNTQTGTCRPEAGVPDVGNDAPRDSSGDTSSEGGPSEAGGDSAADTSGG
jgi:hypothetical protein